MRTSHIIDHNLNNLARWYDNPDIADLMFGSFSYKNDSHVNLLFYDKKARKGLRNFRIQDDNLSWTADVTDTLAGKLVYHPILTISTKNKDFIEDRMNQLLDDIDGINSNDGLPHDDIPALIIIPVLLGFNHFATIVIEPTPNEEEKAKVYYFNSLGTLQFLKPLRIDIISNAMKILSIIE